VGGRRWIGCEHGSCRGSNEVCRGMKINEEMIGLNKAAAAAEIKKKRDAALVVAQI